MPCLYVGYLDGIIIINHATPTSLYCGVVAWLGRESDL